MNTEKLKKHYDWVKMWSGKCSVNSGTKMGEMWTSNKILISEKPIYLSPVVFVVRKGITDCWATQADRDDLGKRLAILARKDLSSIKKLADVYKNKSEHVLSFISKRRTRRFWRSLKNLVEFVKILLRLMMRFNFLGMSLAYISMKIVLTIFFLKSVKLNAVKTLANISRLYLRTPRKIF